MGIHKTFLIFSLAAVTFVQNITTKADAIVTSLVQQNKFSRSILIAKEGKIVFENAYGMANRDWSIPNTIDTKFRFGNVTKQFGAAAIHKLEEQGKLKTTGKACDYLPSYPEI